MKNSTKQKLDVSFIIVFILFSVISIYMLSSIKHTVEDTNYMKLGLIDAEQCETIVKDITISNWNVDSYSLYILQPKHYKKIYKELVVTSGNIIRANRILLSDDTKTELNLYKNGYVRTIDGDHTIFIIPIYHHRIVVAELYVAIDDEIKSENFENTIKNRIAEAQVIGRLIK